MMRYLSVCSGIEAATVAWHPLGWTPAGFAEIEPFPRAVLAHHYPDTPNWGDMSKFQEWPDAAIDVLVGGTPCQAFSVAGLRKGLADPRGNLTLTYLAIAARYRPQWLVWENVPGVLSDRTGAFGSLLGGLAELGYGWAYRVLDAQYFALAQRRRRVFLIGSLGGWASAAAVLFERESLLGHPAPRREARQGTPTIPARSTGGGGLGTDFDCDGGVIAAADPAYCLETTCHDYSRADGFNMVAHSLRGEGFDASEDGTGRGTPLVPVHAFDARQSDVVQYGDMTGPLDTDGHSVAIAFDTTQITSAANYSSPRPGDPCHPLAAGAHPPAIAISESGEIASTLRTGGNDHADSYNSVAVAVQCPGRVDAQGGPGIAGLDDPMFTLSTQHEQHGVLQSMQVRRLTPVECERLQGFPDDYTAIPWRGKPADQCPDGPRYKALGNSMAVPCMAWIGQRIAMVEQLKEEISNG
jgi:DNA (cytosine-5)-methyltransferase 1